MYLLEISILLCSSLYVHTSNIQIPKLWQHNSRKVDDLPDDQTCFCYPEGPLPTIHNLLDPQNVGQQRLVIYLYKNPGSNDIKIYTPNSRKQVLIPDIPYEADDGLISVITESIDTLFYKNPHKIKIFNNRFETVNPSVIDSWPIGLNVGAVEIIYPEDGNSGIPNSGHKVDYDFIPHTKPIETPTGFPTQPHKWPFPGENDNVNSEVIEQILWNNKVEYPHNLPGKVNTNIGIPNDLVYSFHINEGSHDLNIPIVDQYVTFTIWFNHQMKRFQNINLPIDVKVLEYNSLRNLVQQTLAENNIHVTDGGAIIDSKGVVIDASNLELRPVLLGDKIKHQIFQKSFSKITIPKDLPYLEGILVTLVNPPQVLGIIPLGKTYLSQSSFLGNSLNTSTTYFKDYGNANLSPYSTVSNEPISITVNNAYSGAIDTIYPYEYASSYSGFVSSNVDSNIYTDPLSSYSYPSTGEVPHWGGGIPSPVSYPSTGEVPHWGGGIPSPVSYPSTGEVPYWGGGIPSPVSYPSTGEVPNWGGGIPSPVSYPSTGEVPHWGGGIPSPVSYSSTDEVPYWGGGTPSSVPNDPTRWTPLSVMGKRRKLSDAKIEHHYETLNTKNPKKKKKGQVNGKSRKRAGTKEDESKENTTPKPLSYTNTPDSGRRYEVPSIKRVIKTLLNLLDDIPTASSGPSENSTDTNDIVNGSEHINGGGQPDFRIIGGSAATGSGTPLSNKGRSGYEEYI